MRSTLILLLALGLVSTVPLAAQTLETFDAATTGNPGTYPAGWIDGGGVRPWRVHSGGTSSGSTGPSADHTSGNGNYVYCETSSPALLGDTYILNVRPFDSTSVASPALDFWYHMFGATMGTLSVEEFDGVNWNVIFSLTGDQGNAWVNGTAPLLNPSTNTQLRFHYTRGLSFTGDCSIDDVTVPGSFNALPWESNSPGAAVDIDGLTTDGINPVVINTFVQIDSAGNVLNAASGNLTLASNVASGAFYEIVNNTAPIVPLGGGGLDLGGEVVNINLVAGFNGINGGGGTLTLLPMPVTGFPAPGSTTINVGFSLTTATDLSIQGVVTDGGSPLGFRLSQATEFHATVFTTYSVCPGTAGGDLSPLSDNGSIFVILGAPFNFYGTVWNAAQVNMNGNITFGLADSDFTPTEAEMLSGRPRVAPAWDDWDPGDANQGTVRTLDTGSAISVEWFDVHVSGSGCAGVGDSNTFCATLDFTTGDVTFDWGVMGLCSAGSFPTTSTIVGISPGVNISLANNVDLSAGPNLGATATTAIYEDFNQAVFGAFDLGGPGAPPGNQLLIQPTGGLGVGPYVAN